MVRAMKPAARFSIVATIAILNACSPPACPTGAVALGDRCVANMDASATVDAGTIDASIDAEIVPTADAAITASDAATQMDATPSMDAAITISDAEIGDGSEFDATAQDAALRDAGIDLCTALTFYVDTDGDGYGTHDMEMMACTKPTGYAAHDGDCAPTNAAIHPGATEICNDLDDNCDTHADEGFDCRIGVNESCTTTCGSTGTGVCSNTCTLPTSAMCTAPAETCNATDDDCDGVADNGVSAFHTGTTHAFSANALSMTKLLRSPTNYLFAEVNSGQLEVWRLNATTMAFPTLAKALSSTNDVSVADVALSADGATLVAAWQNSAGQTYLASWNTSDFSVHTAEFAFGSSRTVQHSIHITPVGTSWMVSYPNGMGISGEIVDAALGSPSGVLTLASFSTYPDEYELVADTTNHLLYIAATLNDAPTQANAELSVSAYSLTLGTTAPNAYLTADSVSDRYPAIALDGNAHPVVAWMHAGNLVVAQFVATSGALVRNHYTATTSGFTSLSTVRKHPTTILADSGRIIVASLVGNEAAAEFWVSTFAPRDLHLGVGRGMGPDGSPTCASMTSCSVATSATYFVSLNRGLSTEPMNVSVSSLAGTNLYLFGCL